MRLAKQIKRIQKSMKRQSDSIYVLTVQIEGMEAENKKLRDEKDNIKEELESTKIELAKEQKRNEILKSILEAVKEYKPKPELVVIKDNEEARS